MITVTLENEGNMLRTELPKPLEALFDDLGSIGITEPMNNITLSKDSPYNIRLYSDSVLGQAVIERLTGCDDLAALNSLCGQLYKDDYKRDVILISNDADFNSFCDFVRKHNSFVVKPTDSCLSQGVYLETLKDDSKKGIRKLFNQLLGSGAKNQETLRGSVERSVVIEEIIEQGKEMAALHPQSMNCVRLTTVRIGDKVNICFPYVKIGIHGNFLTAAFLGCPTACINSDTGLIETPGVTEDCKIYLKHPDTNVDIIGFKIPKWEELKALATRLSNSLPTLAYTGWDFVWSKNGWCIMEGNEKGEFGWQRNYQKGMKKEFEEMIQWKPKDDFWWKQINNIGWMENE